ncbi:MAG: putative metal transporter metal-binding protein [Frankiales bacterium]|nr:putative metal transporter metal-binding protein [Frankiales bacterium]
MTLNRLLPLALAAAALTAACGSSGASDRPSDGRLVVASTVAPITSIVANIGGDRIELHGIVPEGTNSHTYEPPPQIAEVLSRADVVFVNGLKLEDPTAELADQHKKKDAQVVALGNLVLPEKDYIYDFSFPKADGKPNPHLWTDPLFAIKYADQVAATLSRRDPANKDYYEANRVAFGKKATELSDALKADQATIPAGNKQLLTYHDAYAYFGRDYGWTIIGAVQPSNFEDPTPKDVAALIDQIRKQKVPVIFGSEVFPSKILEQIGKEAGARYEDTLRDDDLPGKPGEKEHSWLGLMRYDYVTMIKGLGGTTTALDALDTSDVAPDKAAYPQ